MLRAKKALYAVLQANARSSAAITPAPEAEWQPVGPGAAHLRGELEALYWDGVRGELENTVRTLRAWQQPSYAGELLAQEDDGFIHGYDTFLDAVSHEARAFAIRYGEKQEADASQKKPAANSYYIQKPKKTHREALKEATIDHRAEFTSSRIKAAVRKAIDEVPRLHGMEARAWTLLQATVTLSQFDEL
ncbi:hypothetical protein B0T26DRAFT_771354 [Lasiosphaeria miniovina]|uniref:Uncharacterized protein n=1 Tax=Lasiosphaeria miniovina TaxID=1954250 RepID=A0AA40E3D9_9PEZI|nr:uncharacterized protein B0T26DRAFT_771354 [Lasiosphaeria miniovina]KAK0722616.1 hypothetical protein B0T26DRAFT_771354 [Lasiosphaeria miniovina]